MGGQGGVFMSSEHIYILAIVAVIITLAVRRIRWYGING